MMPPSSLRQKLGLVAFGLCLTVLTLEAALRLGGFIILSLQEHRNAAALRQKGAYRILCIGESTTQGQYPFFLERELNGRHLGLSFSVIDRGLNATDSSVLVDRTEEYLETYVPDMVVAMMGINDDGPHMPYEPETSSKFVLSIRSLRTYKLARISWMHIASAGNRAADALHGVVAAGWAAAKSGTRPAQAQVTTARATDSQNESITLGRRFLRQGESAEAVAAFRKGLKINPRDADAYAALGLALQNQGRFTEALAAYRKAVEIDPGSDSALVGLGSAFANQDNLAAARTTIKKALEINPRNDGAYVALGRALKDQHHFADAAAAFQKALGINPRNADAYSGLGSVFQIQGRYPQAAAAFQKALEINPGNRWTLTGALWAFLCGGGNHSPLQVRLEESIKGNPAPTDRMYSAASTLYAAMGNPDLAKQYNEKAEQLRLTEFNPTLANNYHRLKSLLDRRGVKLVCAQYPMRGLEPLRKVFQGQTGGIVFVDNEKVFKDAVKGSSLQEYFADMFAGDFGHCTTKGNELLARNIADVLTREVFVK